MNALCSEDPSPMCVMRLFSTDRMMTDHQMPPDNSCYFNLSWGSHNPGYGTIITDTMPVTKGRINASFDFLFLGCRTVATNSTVFEGGSLRRETTPNGRGNS
eukprot:scaffold238_cov95-Cylindrotheca_fusiformis.AAC.2